MQLVIDPRGTLRCVYSEELDLHTLGQTSVRRASHVEPTDDGQWTADLQPVGGPILGPFLVRSAALDAELHWLHEHWLTPDC
jgi:hypothetical protein